MRRGVLLSLPVSFLVLAAVGPVLAQDITGSIVGRVTDPTGAAIPGASILVHNEGTGLDAKGMVTGSGDFSVPNLFAGQYSVTITKPGFATLEIHHLELRASQSLREDVSLKAGQVQETVQVEASEGLLHTENQIIGSSLGAKQLAELPLAARSVDSLIQLAPGVSSTGSNARISGSNYWGGTNFTLNGVSVNDPGNGGGAYTSGVSNLTLANLPDPDSLQEFRVDSADLSAEYRGVATVTMVTKAGTNAFHGELYEFFQNAVLNANQFLLKATGQRKPVGNLNQFGLNAGGPILRNRIFIFGAYRGIQQDTSAVASLTMPSIAMRNGDFSALCTSTFVAGICSTPAQQLYNPFTGQALPNNNVSSLITSQAKTLMTYLPALTVPTSTGLPGSSPNYIASRATIVGINGIDGRLDGVISSKDSIYAVGHYSKGSPWQLASTSYPSTYGNNPNYGYTDYAISATETHIFSPTMVNDFRAAWVDHASVRTGQNTNFQPWSLFPQLPITDNGGLPTMTMTGYTGMFYDYGKGYPFPEYDVEFLDNFTKVLGRHTLKFGFDESGYKISIKQGGPALSTTLGNPLSTFTFTGDWTGNKGYAGAPGGVTSQGNAFADFLIGTADSSNYAGPITNIVSHNRDWEFYGQDTFQILPRLTLSFGIRYMYQEPWQIRDNRVSYMDLAHNALALPENSATVTTPAFAVPALMTAYPYETTQNAGWPTSYFIKDTNNFGPRIGFAYRMFNDRAVLRGGFGVFYNSIPGFIGQHENQFNAPFRTGATYTSKLPSGANGYQPDITFANPFPSSGTSGPSAHPIVYMTQRDLQNSTVYQWNLTYEHQFWKDWAGRASWVGTNSPNALIYAGDINRPSVQQPGVPTQSQRPYQPWSNILETQTISLVNFDQLQLELNHQMSHGFLVQAEYSFTAARDDSPLTAGVQNVGNYRADYGNTDGTPKQIFAVNYLYDLPFGAHRAHPFHNGFAEAVAGGWTVSGITVYRTGTPYTVSFTVPSSLSASWFGGRADKVLGANPYSKQGGHNIIAGVQYFNPASFAPPAQYQWGDSQRNGYFGPGYWNYDASLLKTFSIVEKQALQFRCDFFDLANHFNLSNPNLNIADTRDGGAAIATSGKITTGTGSRVIQFGLKYSF